MKDIPPPSAGDVLHAVSALGWPAVTVDGRVSDGEAAWRATLESASPEARWRLWTALRDEDEAGREARASANIRTTIDGYARAVPSEAEHSLVRRVARLASRGRGRPEA